MHGSHTKRVTLYDVAHQSGVSYQTVSRVINDHPHVSEATRQRVLRVIKELDYRPNRAARSLVTRRSFTLEIITFGSNFYGPAKMVASVERAAKARGYNLTFSNLDSTEPESFRGALDSISERLVDGLVIISPTDGTPHDQLLALCRGIPTVLVDNEQGAVAPSVIIDQHYGGVMLAKHLLELGHREICEISGPLNWYGAKSRQAGLRETLSGVGVSLVASSEGDWTPLCGYDGTRRLLDSGARFTALVAGNDHTALGAMRALREHGLDVPRDVSVVGFDNIPETAYYEPPLTTVHQDFEALGSQSVEYLVDLISSPETPVHQRVLYPYFVERQSTRRLR
jgi:LacI family transcriptional regulator